LTNKTLFSSRLKEYRMHRSHTIFLYWFIFKAWNNQVQCQGRWHLQALQYTQYKSQISYNSKIKKLI